MAPIHVLIMSFSLSAIAWTVYGFTGATWSLVSASVLFGIATGIITTALIKTYEAP